MEKLYALLRDDLSDRGQGIGIRITRRYVPIGDVYEVQPPTYSSGEKGPGGKERPTFHLSIRRINGRLKVVVLLDSIPSQANRLEELMERKIRELLLPVVATDIAGYMLTQYSTPHRIYDAYFNYSKLDGTPFYETDLGRMLIRADTWTATPLFRYAPNVLLFGGWASHADEKALDIVGGKKRIRQAQAKIERAMEAMILGIVDDITEDGKVRSLEEIRRMFTVGKTASRKDPLNVTMEMKRGKASELGFGHVTPTVDEVGYITIEEALYQSLINFPVLRKLYFPVTDDGIAYSYSEERDTAGRVVLAALGIHLIALYLNRGAIQLRSRATLVPKDLAPVMRYMRGFGREEEIELDAEQTAELYRLALEEADRHGLRFEKECVRLVFDEGLVDGLESIVFRTPAVPPHLRDICKGRE